MALAELEHFVQKLLLALLGAADQADGIVDPFFVAGNDGLEVQHFPHDGGDVADAPALFEVFERIHVEHDLAVIDLAVKAVFDLFECPAVLELRGGPDRPDARCHGDVLRVKDEDLKLLLLGRCEADRIECAGQAAGDRHSNDLFIACVTDLIEDVLDLRQRGRGGTRVFVREPAVYHQRIDIYFVVVIFFRVHDAKRKHPYIVFLAKICGHITARIDQYRDLLFVHNFCLSLF